MTSPEPDFDSLVAALRSDLPSTSDEERVRRRLLAAGLGVATSMVAPGATASGLVGGSSVTLLQKLGALSWTVKLGLAGVAVTAALPAAVSLTSTKQSSPAVDVAPVAPRVPARKLPPSPQPASLPVSQPAAPAETTPFDSIATRAPAAVPHEPAAVSPLDPPRANALPLPERASSAAFPTDEADDARARSTLGQETALVERALYALRRGDHVDARRALEEHARRFPNGLLARERDRALLRANAVDDPESPAAPR